MTILGKDKLKYKKQITHYFLLLASVSVAVAVTNILLAVFRTDATHIAFLVINILTDIALLWGIIYTIVNAITPKRKLLVLYERGEKNGKSQIGKVKRISKKTERYQGFACCAVTVETGSADYELYLIAYGIGLETDKSYKFITVENLIISAEETE